MSYNYTSKPRWADETEENILDPGLSSGISKQVVHAGEMFKTSSVCNGQVTQLSKYGGKRADYNNNSFGRSEAKD